MKKTTHLFGFTFVELLIYMAMLSSFLVVLGTLLFSILDTQLESLAASSVDLDGQYLLTRLTYDIHRASAITVPASAGSSATFLTLTISGVAHDYSLTGSHLTLSVSGISSQLNSYATQISNFSVTRLGNPSGKPSLQLSFDVTSTTTNLQSVPQDRSYQTTINLR